MMKTIPLILCLAGTLSAQEYKVRVDAPVIAHAGLTHVEGINLKAVKGAPYSAKAVTTTTQTLADGNRITNTTEVRLARDSQGRTRREQKLAKIGPWSTDEPGSVVTITDPSTGSTYTTNSAVTAHASGGEMVRTLKTATSTSPGVIVHSADANSVSVAKVVAGSPLHTIQFKAASTVPDGNTTTEDLGTQVVEGLMVQGKRSRTTLPAGTVGNERPLQIVSESWWSPELQMVVLSKRSDPRTGEVEFRLTEVSRAEPDAALFEAKK